MAKASKATTTVTTMSADAPANISVNIADNQFGAGRKTFASGSVGYYGSGKVYIAGQAYQVSLNVVLVKSKPIG